MHEAKVNEYTVISVGTLIIGAGAAGLKCAEMLAALGVGDVAIVVDRLGAGTSNNSGSDKQTYYKIGIFGDEPDSPMDFARSLWQGGMMHGDLAYIEALGSAPAFFDLCRIGVPFPFNRYGAYVGYKTDHDPRQRATSAGPKTSKFMFERLLEQVRAAGVKIFDRHSAIRLLVRDGRAYGAICLDKSRHYDEHHGMVLFNANNVVLATGGPGELYRDSVWPSGQAGTHGMAFDAGVNGNNLTELQFGLASVDFRWNLSGTYQQVIPDYYSVDSEGTVRHFLHDYYPDMPTMALNIFLKGYQWPFHAARLQDYGSSLIDIAVAMEGMRGRKVFMDFAHNPVPASGWRDFAICELPEEARTYLERSGALQSTPYERLRHMNPASIDLFSEHGIDLRKPLQVKVCAQHCNGGLGGDVWWESRVRHLFVIGELCGTHGVRPGGSALNSGQVGAMRAAQRIANVYHQAPMDEIEFMAGFQQVVDAQSSELSKYMDGGALSPVDVRRRIQERMSDCGAFLRSLSVAKRGLVEAREQYEEILKVGFDCRSAMQLPLAVETKWLALTSVAFLQAIVSYIERGGGSRGAFMVLDDDGDMDVLAGGVRCLRHRRENMEARKEILEVALKTGTSCDFDVTAVSVRPLPEDDSWFENTWADFADGRIFQER